ncbi:Pr6Pr family membrane protein [Agromyces sp. LHK192]|uniref:Pr6Pr family membrane protein n=1 Tax=Agromyces sp. LHK192 TaxID=2498704 RepID=UPI000FD8789D|nr:Pr6Pr family membrane protein [Agromyces sp. LHK192]
MSVAPPTELPLAIDREPAPHPGSATELPLAEGLPAPHPRSEPPALHEPREVDRAAFTWRIVIVATLVAGLASGGHGLHLFTAQVGVIAIGYFAAAMYLAVARGDAGAPAPRLRGAVVFWLLTAMLVGHLVEGHGDHLPMGLLDAATPAELLANRSVFLLQYVAPVLVLLDLVLFRPHGVARFRDIPLWLVLPAGSVAVTVARAELLPGAPDPYPYAILDPAGVGYGTVLVQVLLLGVCAAALAAAVIGLDRLLGRMPDRRLDRTTRPAEAG